MRASISLLMLLSIASLPALAQNSASCPAAPSALNPTKPNIFNERQEMDLGDALAEIKDPETSFVNDPAGEAYLAKIGQRLLAGLPPNHFDFRYRIIDLNQVNASSIAGGHIYVSRKLIAAAANEDEVAGVVAHEIGHLLMHQTAIRITDELADVLHVTSVTDRADIFDKLHRLRNASRLGAWSPSGEPDEENSDAIAVYALMKAGYSPGAYADFWNQVQQLHGKSGTALGAYLHGNAPAEQRLRRILKEASAIPASCEGSAVSASADFIAWQRQVIAAPRSAKAAADEANAVPLTPPMRSDLTRLQFSPDGKFALAQDQSTVYVMGRSPLRFLFQFDAPDADPAWFSPDSSRVVMSTPSLHVEEWEVATGHLLAGYEVLSYQPCMQHLLSPDGRTMACILFNSRISQSDLNLTLWDVESGQVIFTDDHAFTGFSGVNVNFGYGFTLSSNRSMWVDSKLGWPFIRWAFTPDGRRLMANREPTMLVYDLDQHSMVKAEGAVAKLDRKPAAFVGSDRIAIDNWDNPQKSGVYSFPDGKQLQQVAMGDQDLSGVTRGNYVKLTPMKDQALGLMDLDSGQIRFSLPDTALDIYDHTAMLQTGEGSVELTSQGLVADAKGAEILDLPVGYLGKVDAAVASADGKYLALSNKSRCAIWNAQTGDRLFYLRPFSAGFFDENDTFMGDFPLYRGQAHSVFGIDPHQHRAFKLPYEPLDHATQNGDVLTEIIPSTGLQATTTDNVDLEVRDAKTSRLLWKRHFPHHIPQIAVSGDQMVFTLSRLFEGTGHDELKAHPELQAQYSAIKEPQDATLVEAVDSHTGAYLKSVVADVRYSDVFSLRLILNAPLAAVPHRTYTFGDFALFGGQMNGLQVYRFSTGARLGEVFGDAIASSPATGLFCVLNRGDELVVYDAATVAERKRIAYGSAVRFAQFIDAGKQLMVVTADQIVHRIDYSDLSSAPPAMTAAAKPSSR